MSRKFSVDMDRRTFLKITGAGGAAGVTGLAGCTGEVGDDADTGGDTTEGDTGTGTGGTGNETGSGSGGGEGGEIVPGTAPGFPPFEMRNDQGELVGFDIDLLEAVVEPTSYTLGEWQTFEFSSLIPALRNDRIDVIAAAMTITEDRQETIAFSNPYYSADQAVLVAEGSDFSPEALDDLGGHPVGAQEGTTGAGVVQDELIDGGTLQQSNFNTYGSYVLAVEDLENGNVDAVVLDLPVARTFAEQRDVTVAFVYETGEQYGFGIRQDASDLQSALNSGLEQVRGSGTYEELRNEWFAGSSSGSGGNATGGNTTGGNTTGGNTTASGKITEY
jgi:polar amino acid transport system substrate-binding protein